MHYVYPYPHVDEVIPLMAEGKILPYLDIPFQHASPARAEVACAAPATRRRPWSASTRGARSARTSPSARPSSSASPARPRTISRFLLRLAEGGQDRPGRLLPLRAGAGRARQRHRRRRSAGGQGRALAPLHADAAGGQRQDPEGARSASACRSSSTSRAPTVATGRTKYDAPEIDGAVYVASRPPAQAGDIVNVKIESSDEYDLHGTVV